MPQRVMTYETWTDTAPTGTGSQGFFAESPSGRNSVRKPGKAPPGNLDGIREFLGASIAPWLTVNVPEVELVSAGDGPCVVSLFPGKVVYKWAGAMEDPLYAQRASALAALSAYSPIVVLDSLLGNTDRTNPGNHIFVEDTSTWYSVDYTPSCGNNPAAAFQETYYPEIIAAVGANPGALQAALALAESIPDEAFDRLLSLPPTEYASASERDQMAVFLKIRRSNLRQILQDWCTMVGHAGALKC